MGTVAARGLLAAHVERWRQGLPTALGSCGAERVRALLDRLRDAGPPPAPAAGRRLHPLLHVPGLRAVPYWDPRRFALATQLRHAFPVLRDEALRLLATPGVFETEPGAALRGDSRDPASSLVGDWRGYYLHRYFRPQRLAASGAPVAARVLSGAALSREAMLSFLAPGGYVRPHSDLVNFIVTVYLPLVVRGPSWIRFAGQVQDWREGEVFVADSTFVHDSAHQGAGWRAVLIADVWHPELDEQEVRAFAHLLPLVDDVLRALGARRSS